MQGFSIETHQYRSGEKPLEIVTLKTCKTRWKVVSVDPMGCTQLHGEDGSFNGTKGIESEHDLVPIPPKPEVVYWGKPEDVPGDADWFYLSAYGGGWHRLTGVHSNGLSMSEKIFDWEELKEFNATWSATRLGEYRPCTTTSEGV